MADGPTTAALQITLLGTPTILWTGATLLIARRQTHALLYRLAVELRPVARAHLCALFWPELPDTAARRNLTHLLTHLRRALPKPDLLQADSLHITFSHSSVASDTAALFRLGASAQRPLETLRQAAALLRGPFLDGFSLPDCPEFDA